MGVASKIQEVMKRVEYLKKDKKVEYGTTNYGYLSEEKITTEIRKAMIEVGLVAYPIDMKVVLQREVQGKYNTSYVTVITTTFRLKDTESGEFDDVMTFGEGSDIVDKDFTKAMTSAFKYMQREVFFIASGNESDKISSEEIIDLLNGEEDKGKGKKTPIETKKDIKKDIKKEPEAEPKVEISTEQQQSTISIPLQKLLFESAKNDNKIVMNVIKKHNYDSTKKIRLNEYETILAEILEQVKTLGV